MDIREWLKEIDEKINALRRNHVIAATAEQAGHQYHLTDEQVLKIMVVEFSEALARYQREYLKNAQQGELIPLVFPPYEI